MTIPTQWHFAQPGSLQRQRDSNLQSHFDGSGTDRAGDVVREGGQNSMDARPDEAVGPVRVRIAFGSIPRDRALRYAAGLREHAVSIHGQRPRDRVAAALGEDPCAYLLFEDFNTTGLTGDPGQMRRYEQDARNAYHTFVRAEGQTDKTDPNKQGSKGVGKVTFLAASRARALLGLTARADGRKLLFGTAVLHTHRHEGGDYDADAWYGTRSGGGGVMPIEEHDAIAGFRNDFGLTRRGEPGLSVVVPWLETDEEEGVTPGRVIDAVLRSHVWPILQGRLTVEVVPEGGEPAVIDAGGFSAVLDARPDGALKHQVRPLAELIAWALTHRPGSEADRLGPPARGAPKWDDPGILKPEQRDRLRSAFDAGDPIAVRVPVRVRRKGPGAADIESHFDLFLQSEHDAAAAPGPSVHFVRGGLLIAGMARRVRGVRGLVVAEEKGLAGFLRDAENASHTKWNAKPIKDRYTFAPGLLNFVLDAAKGLTTLLAGDPTAAEAVWTESLHVSGGEEARGPGDGRRHKRKQDKSKVIVDPPEPPRPVAKPYTINTTADGLQVFPSGNPFTGGLPARLELRLAYHIRGHNPLAKWHRNDFNLERAAAFPAIAAGCELVEREPNRLVLRIDDAEGFRFTVSGFDTRRELFCKPRLLPGADLGEGDEDGALAGARADGDDA